MERSKIDGLVAKLRNDPHSFSHCKQQNSTNERFASQIEEEIEEFEDDYYESEKEIIDKVKEIFDDYDSFNQRNHDDD